MADFQSGNGCTREPGTLINVLGAIPACDPILREEIVIVGAHRDHFGKQAGLLFPGADDNASGTALLLETARIMTEPISRPKRTIVFASFSGEERGLLRGKTLCKKSKLPFKQNSGHDQRRSCGSWKWETHGGYYQATKINWGTSCKTSQPRRQNEILWLLSWRRPCALIRS